MLQHLKEWSDLYNKLITLVEILAKLLYVVEKERVVALSKFQVRRNRVLSGLLTDSYSDATGCVTAPARRRTQLQPLLEEAVDQTTRVLNKSIPISQLSSLDTVAFINDEHVICNSQGLEGNRREKLNVDNVATGSTL